MRFRTVPMDREKAVAISQWTFGSFYSFYDLRNWPEDLEEWLDPANWGDTLAVLDDDGELVGEYSFTPDQDKVEIGLTLRPDLNGRGLGADFVAGAVQEAVSRYGHRTLVIRVWELNVRARKAYEKAGFVTCGKERVVLEGMPFTFLRLSRRT